MKITPCSCEESQHLREALRVIMKIATNETDFSSVDDLAQIANLAEQGLRLQRLVGDPAIGSLVKLMAKNLTQVRNRRPAKPQIPEDG